MEKQWSRAEQAALARFRGGKPTARDVARLAAAFGISAEPKDEVIERDKRRGLGDALRQLDKR